MNQFDYSASSQQSTRSPRAARKSYYDYQGQRYEAAPNYFLPNVNLTPDQEKYCRCELHVMARQPPACLQDQAWFQQREGKTCYNPYAGCAKSTGTSMGSGGCGKFFDFQAIPDPELIAYAHAHNLPVPVPYDRQHMIFTLQNWQRQKY